MWKLCIAIAASSMATSLAAAESESYSFPYTYSMATDGDVYPRLTIPGFDDMNGSRLLTRVDVRVQAEIAATIAIENMTHAELSDWTVEGQHIVLTGFERENPPDFGPFAFLGGLFIDQFTGTLAPSDGVEGSGDDYFAHSDSVSIDSILDMDPFFNDFFTGTEVLAVVGPFTEFFLGNATPYDPTLGMGDAIVGFTELSQSGTFTVSYQYSVVPEPGSLLALGGAGLLLVRRRR